MTWAILWKYYIKWWIWHFRTFADHDQYSIKLWVMRKTENILEIKSAWHDPQHHPTFFHPLWFWSLKFSHIFSDFCGEMWFEYSKYFRRSQLKRWWKLENEVTTLNKTIKNKRTIFSYTSKQNTSLYFFPLWMRY